MSQKQYLTYTEFAERFGVSLAYVKRHVADGDIPAIRIGSVVRIPASVLDAMEHEAFVGSLLEQAPPLTDEQRCKLAEILKPVRG